jgi:hypothetical protein
MRAADCVGKVRTEFPGLNGIHRLRQLVLYISGQYEDDPYFGATRLNKVLYEADHESFLRFGEPITGVIYVRERQGPVPREMDGILRDMHAEGEINIRHVPHPNRSRLKLRRVEAQRDPDLNFLNSGQRHLLDFLISRRWGESAESASARTHGRAWEIAKHREAIPYEAAFLSDDQPTQEDIKRTQELSSRFGWGSY